MSTATPGSPARSRLLLAAAAAAGVLALLSAVSGALGLVPTPLVVAVVLGAAGLGGRVLLGLQARRSPSAARLLRILVRAGLALSGAAALATIVSALRTGGSGAFALDLVVQGWTLILLIVAATSARTVGGLSLLGVGLAGFLAVPALARLIGTPVVDTLGVDDVFATSVWVPATEEVLKAAPVLVVALLAARRTESRPAALDLALLGGACGAGFALFENLQFARVVIDPAGALPFTLLVPGMQQVDAWSWSGHVAGHLVWTALVGAAIGFGVLYRRRRYAWLAIPVAFAVVTTEHGVLNASEPPALLLVLIAHGLLSTVLLVAAVVALAVVERRPTGDLAAALRGSPEAAARQHASLAARQCGVGTGQP